MKASATFEASATIDENQRARYRTTSMNPFLERNTQIYGAKKGKWVTRMLSDIGVHSKQDFVDTFYRDAAQLASDVEHGLVSSQNQSGQILDLFHKPVCNLGDNIYAALNQTHEILFYFVNYGGAQRLVNCAGEFIYDASVCDAGIIGIYPAHSIYHHTRSQNVQVHGKHYLSPVVLGPISIAYEPKSPNDNNRDSEPEDHNREVVLYNQKTQANRTLSLKSDHNVFRGMFSDVRLKTRMELIRENYIRQGIHLYRFYWNETAKHLFGLQGKEYGLLTREIKMYYSHNVHSWTQELLHEHDQGHHNPTYEYISISAQEAQENQELRKIAYIMQNKTLFNRSVDYLLKYRKPNTEKPLDDLNEPNSSLWNRICKMVGWNPTDLVKNQPSNHLTTRQHNPTSKRSILPAKQVAQETSNLI